jgi:transcriptional regulator with XRE-family HTH domain
MPDPFRPPAADQPAGGSPHWSTVLRALREARGVTQEGWATRLGVGRRTLQRWERGDIVPDEAAERAILAACREMGLFRTFDRGPLRALPPRRSG